MAVSISMSQVAIGRFADTILRGIGQVMFQNNPVTGLLFLLGIFISHWVNGLYALLGTVASTATAMLFGAPRDDVGAGLNGFNGTLTGIALAFYLRHDPVLPAYVIIASMFVTVVMAAFVTVLGSARVPALTGPFVLTAWIFAGALYSYGLQTNTIPLLTPHLPTHIAPTGGPLSLSDVISGILNGPGQVMFSPGIPTGIIFLIALAVNSRIACAAAILGSALGVGVGLAFGAAPGDIRDGFYGFNAVLTAIALGGLFYLLDGLTVLLAILGVCVSTALYGMMADAISPTGLPVLTAPFVITTWLCLLARPSLTRLRALPLAEVTTPEGNLRAARQARPEGEPGEVQCPKRSSRR